MELAVFLIIPIYLLVGTVFWFVGLARKDAAISERRRQLSSNTTIITEYTPPPGLKPAEIAYLYDQSVGTEEYLSTLFDLEARGYVTLHQGTKPGLIITEQTEKPAHDLTSFELEALLTAKSSETDMHRYGSWTERLWGNQFDFLLELELQKKGLLAPVVVRTWSFSWLNVALMGGALLWVYFMASFGTGIESFNELDSYISTMMTVFFVIFGLAVTMPFVHFGYRTYKRASRLANMTESLEKLWPQIEGYRTYVKAVDLSRIQFANGDDEAFAHHEALPYAIALNLSTEWQKRFDS